MEFGKAMTERGAGSIMLNLQAGMPLTIHMTIGESLPSGWITKE
jgi:hypothetical protein